MNRLHIWKVGIIGLLATFNSACKCDDPSFSIGNPDGEFIAGRELHFFAEAKTCGSNSFKTCNCNSFRWVFGDGTTSADESPIHAFAQAGTYVVSLEVANQEEKSHKAEISVVIAPPPPKPTASIVFWMQNYLYVGKTIDITLGGYGTKQITGVSGFAPVCDQTTGFCAEYRGIAPGVYSYTAAMTARTWTGSVDASQGGCILQFVN
jgi:hypothetical protein